MYRSTTPSFIFKLSINIDDIQKGYINFKQFHNNKTLLDLEKTLDDCEIVDSNRYKLTLTQEETLKFVSYTNAEVQLKIKLIDNTVLASKIYTIPVEKIFKNEVI